MFNSELIGRLIYIFRLSLTHPDIAYVVNVISQFMRDPRSTHLEPAKIVVRYLKTSLIWGYVSVELGIYLLSVT